MRTYKLSDFSLQRGDWIKLDGYKGWQELLSISKDWYRLEDSDLYPGHWSVEAVLRPSVIIRDNIGIPAFNLYPQTITFQNIHPKEEKKSFAKRLMRAYEEPYYPITEVLIEMGAEIDKLKEGK